MWELQIGRGEGGCEGVGRPVVSRLSSQGTSWLTHSAISVAVFQLYKFKANVLNWLMQEWNIIEQEPARGMLGETWVQTHFCARMGRQGPRKTQYGEAVDTKSKTIRNVQTILEIMPVSTDQPNGNRGPWRSKETERYVGLLPSLDEKLSLYIWRLAEYQDQLWAFRGGRDTEAEVRQLSGVHWFDPAKQAY